MRDALIPPRSTTRHATRIRRQMRLYPRELRVREPELIAIHSRVFPEVANP
jgi:hypothetical protein